MTMVKAGLKGLGISYCNHFFGVFYLSINICLKPCQNKFFCGFVIIDLFYIHRKYIFS